MFLTISCVKEKMEEQKAQENLEEIKAYIIQQGLSPDDVEIELTDPAQASNPTALKEMKAKIDLYVKERKVMEKKFERMTVLREKMKKAKTAEDVEKLVQEYPDLFITSNSPNVIKKN
jgi:hypothetical protein